MNTIELYINRQLADCPSEDFTYNLQVNDMFSFEKRNTSYSQGIKLPKTPTNLSIFSNVGVPMVKSLAPYQVFEVQYRVNGMYIVKKGTGYIKEITPNYILFWFQDGNIDLYNALDNKNLYNLPDVSKDIGQGGLTHTKSQSLIQQMYLQTVEHLLYALGDYGGDTYIHNTQGKNAGYNFDYCVPSIQALWVMKQIEKLTGKKFECSLFDDEVFKRTYMTISSTEDKIGGKETWEVVQVYKETIDEPGFLEILRTTQASKYRLTGTITLEGFISEEIMENQHGDIIGYDVGWVHLSITNILNEEIGTLGRFYKKIELNHVFSAVPNLLYLLTINSHNVDELKVTLHFSVERGIVVTTNYLNDFQLKDWFKEILTLHSLTPIPYINNKGEEIYRLVTLNERCSAPMLDWSEKLVEIQSQTYLNSNYGKKNIFSYQKYDKESTDNSYADKTLYFNNQVLKEKAEFESMFYAPHKKSEEIGSVFFDYQFELWKKEVKQEKNGSVKIEYKPKDNRFHLFVARTEVPLPNRTILCALNDRKTLFYLKDPIVVADFSQMKWSRIYSRFYRYYLPYLMDKPTYVKATFNLNEVDVSRFDFYSRIYLKQLGAYFLPLKIQYKVGSFAVVELLKIPDRLTGEYDNQE